MTPRRGRVLLFWDYDAEWGAAASRTGRKPWGMLEFEHTERLLDLHRQRDIHACFACVGAVALPGERPFHDPAQIRRLHAAGHEIASHSHKHEWLPALSARALRESLRDSKAALEDCIGAEVITFVPPWNQPYDFLARGSLSLSERRALLGSPRTDVPRLCETLSETGYRFVRLGFRSLGRRLADAAGIRRPFLTTDIKELRGIAYVLLTSPAGFDEAARRSVEKAVSDGGIAVIWGHPHSLSAGNAQHERHLVPFLDWVADLRSAGNLDVTLPRELLESPPASRKGLAGLEAAR